MKYYLLDKVKTYTLAFIASIFLSVLCGCSNTLTKVVSYRYAVVQEHILKKGGTVICEKEPRSSKLTIVESSSNGTTPDHTWITATEISTNATRIEVESVKDVAFTYWQKGRERQRLREFLKDLK